MRTISLLLLSSLLAVTAVACKYERPAQNDVADKGVLVDNQGNPLQPSTEAPVAKEQPTTAPNPNEPAIDTPPVAPNDGSIPAPPDVAAVPADAQKSASGLAWKVLQPGTGAEKPGPNDTVKAHYTGWTTDGKMFDTSATAGEPIEFGLGQVIAGWTEGLQLMVKGEKRRFWIPEALAYQGRPGAPAGMLVFDVELVDFRKAPETPADLTSPPADAEKTASGLVSRVLQPGTGTLKAGANDLVEMQFSGWTSDGKLFESTSTRGAPITAPLSKLPAGWSEGIMLMVEGEKRRLWVPEELAFKGRPGAPQGTLVFDIELIKIVKMPETPADVAAAPADAEKTASGLASKVITPGTGTEHPKATSEVEVHYAGWTTDGKMFDTSYKRGKPTQFRLNEVIPGWTEGVQLMVVGEKRRFWIPEELAYKDKPGRPQGMLVFDIELLSIPSP